MKKRAWNLGASDSDSSSSSSEHSETIEGSDIMDSVRFKTQIQEFPRQDKKTPQSKPKEESKTKQKEKNQIPDLISQKKKKTTPRLQNNFLSKRPVAANDGIESSSSSDSEEEDNSNTGYAIWNPNQPKKKHSFKKRNPVQNIDPNLLVNQKNKQNQNKITNLEGRNDNFKGNTFGKEEMVEVFGKDPLSPIPNLKEHEKKKKVFKVFGDDINSSSGSGFMGDDKSIEIIPRGYNTQKPKQEFNYPKEMRDPPDNLLTNAFNKDDSDFDLRRENSKQKDTVHAFESQQSNILQGKGRNVKSSSSESETLSKDSSVPDEGNEEERERDISKILNPEITSNTSANISVYKANLPKFTQLHPSDESSDPQQVKNQVRQKKLHDKLPGTISLSKTSLSSDCNIL
jgi:hypothetical protein